MSNIIPFQFHGQEVVTIQDEQGEPWFVAKDVCDALKHPCRWKDQETLGIYDILAIGSDLDNQKEAVAFLIELSKYVSHLGKDTPTFWQLYMCALVNIYRNSEYTDCEYSWHEVFVRHVSTLIPGASIVPRPKRKGLTDQRKKGGGIPDFFVQIDKNICPVEIKRTSFTNAAVRQLRGYITGFEAPYGFAVARDCPGILDDNMIFLSLEGLDKEP